MAGRENTITEGCRAMTVFVPAQGAPEGAEGSVAVGAEAYTYDVGKALSDGGGQIDTTDPELISALTEYPLVQTQVPDPGDDTQLSLSVESTENPNELRLAVTGAAGDHADVNWGDGQQAEGFATDELAGAVHAYPGPGTWTITVTTQSQQGAVEGDTRAPDAGGQTREELEAMTVSDLKSLADSRGVSYNANATKAELVDLLAPPEGS